MAATTLIPDRRRILAVPESEAGREGIRWRQLDLTPGLDAVPTTVEELRSKARRPVERR
ncbi:hypothetical protein OG226_48985 [Streptomyces sp. NBC_01261]|uniref:hypothetical protein n=1 Tax=unclassified Streptomyces TaxID=2593676 RepID=UPI002E2DD795|nr:MULTISPECIES: hypothetical protein [unclassified Streptomyces]